MSISRVSLIRGPSRYDNVRQSLDAIAAEIDLSGKKRVLIKPNFVLTDKPLAATHVDAVRAVLDFMRQRYDGPLAIAEGPALQTAREGFRTYGYEPLAQTYDVTLRDLNSDESVPVSVYDWQLRPLQLGLARSVVESDYRISVGPPKTHDFVIITLSLKNMIMGTLISQMARANPPTNGQRKKRFIPKGLLNMIPHGVRRLPPVEWLQFRTMSLLMNSDKTKMHQSHPIMNLNLALIAPLVKPHLAVIDGFEAMEGNGPTDGTPVPWQLALASTDSLAADVTCASMMGFKPDEIGYLHYCKKMGLGQGDPAKIAIVGNAEPELCTRAFRPHAAYARQRRWHLPDADKYLALAQATT